MNYKTPKISKQLVICFDYNTGKIIIPDGYIVTKLTVTQLKLIGVITVKGQIGYRWWKRDRFPKTVNLISITDLPRTEEYSKNLTLKHLKRRYSADIIDWLLE